MKTTFTDATLSRVFFIGMFSLYTFTINNFNKLSVNASSKENRIYLCQKHNFFE